MDNFSERYTDDPNMKFGNIDNEVFRVYVFPPTRVGEPNNEYRVEEPEAINFKAPVGTWVAGGSHRVVDKAGRAHYIPSGWIAMYWDKPKGEKPFRW